MSKQSAIYRHIDNLFELPIVFNAYQALVDGGKTRQIKRFLSGLEYDSVVDIGCGTGNWATISDAKYLGVDTSPSFIEGCKRRYRGDESKTFVQADATSLGVEESFDLGMLISVLHHLPDEKVYSLIEWLSQTVHYFFVLDLYPIQRNPVSKWLYQMDRGDHIRSPLEQKSLLLESGKFRLVKSADYFSPNRLYRHTMFLLETV